MFSRAIFGFSRCTWPKIALAPPPPDLLRCQDLLTAELEIEYPWMFCTDRTQKQMENGTSSSFFAEWQMYSNLPSCNFMLLLTDHSKTASRLI